jgi:hypothetical protein
MHLRDRLISSAILRLKRGSVRARRGILDLARRFGSDALPEAGAINAEENDPIIIIGCHRSGTSLVRRMLDSHSRIACPAETLFLEHLGAVVGDDYARRGLGAIGLNSGEVEEDLHQLVWRYFSHYTAKRGKKRWADKSPGTAHHLTGIDRILRGRAKYLYVTRCGLDVSYSLGAARPVWQQLGPYLRGSPDSFTAAAYYWRDMNEKCLAFAAEVPQRVGHLSYERLVAEPELTMKQVFAFLGESWEPSILDFNAHQHDSGLEDHIVSTTTRVENHQGKHKALPTKLQEALREIVRPTTIAIERWAQRNSRELAAAPLSGTR